MAQKVVIKRRRKVRWKVVIPTLIACVLVVYLFGSLVGMIVNSFTKDDNSFTACKLSTSKLQKKLSNKEYEGYIEVVDYVVYGENLNLYSSEYVIGGRNAFTGKTMVLKNVCTDKEYTIEKLGSDLDGQINGLDLEVGLYEVYIVDNLLEKRLYMSSALTEEVSFYTSTMKSTNTKVELLADASLINKEGAETNALDRNYVFINVTKETMPETSYDIMLNPGPITINNNVGLEANGVTEETEMYRLAKRVKELLEKEGLKVGIAREEYTWLSLYGESGTLAKGYSTDAKYFISLAASGGSDTQQGISIVHSAFVSNSLANKIHAQLVKLTNMEVLDVEESALTSGYDADLDIREAGGRALGAGELVEANVFASNLKGMEAIYMEVFNINNSADVALWQQEFENVAKAIAQGIIDYINQ